MSQKKFKKELAEVMANIHDPKLLNEFLERILTPGEHDEIAVRLQIFNLLHQGVPQRKIAAQLGVSIGTISRGAREVKYGGTDFSKILKA